MKLQSLTNVRPTKALGTQVIASCTKGQFKLTPDASRKLGVTSGDYADILEDVETNTFYITKGEKGNGGKLAGQGGSLMFSAAVAWGASKADEDHNTHYNLGEGVTTEEGQEVFPLEFDSKVVKQARGAKASSEDAQAVTDAGNTEEEASFEEM